MEPSHPTPLRNHSSQRGFHTDIGSRDLREHKPQISSCSMNYFPQQRAGFCFFPLTTYKVGKPVRTRQPMVQPPHIAGGPGWQS